MNVLVTGGKGQVGREVARVFAEAGCKVLAPGKEELDVTDRGSVARIYDTTAPDVVVHCAAWTDVDGCEQDPEHARQINTCGTALVSDEAARRGATLVYISTDFVFDGKKQAPYEPHDPPSPINAYGRSKWEGERAVVASGCSYYIVRTAWVYGISGRNFPKAVLRIAAGGGALRVVDDQRGSPTFASDLAEGIVAIKDHVKMAVDVRRISSDELDYPARRPPYSVLSCRSLRDIGIRLRSTGEALEAFLEKLQVVDAELFPSAQ